MKKLSGILWLSFLLVAVVPVGARPQFGRNNNRSGDRVCVYQNSYFQGWEECFRPGDEVADLHTHSNNISSIRVYGNAIVSVFDGRNFDGISLQVTSEQKDLAQVSAGGFSKKVRASWNDRIESFRVTSPNFRSPVSQRDDRDDDRPGRGRGRRDADSVCVYEETDYRGRVECFDSGADFADLGRAGDWSDRISSVRVIGDGRAAAYVDIGYRGERVILDHDVPDLKRLRLRDNRSWDNQISSLEVGGGRRTVGRR